MSNENTTEIGKSPTKSMFAELLKLSLEMDSLPDAATDEDVHKIHDRQWAIRAQIDTTTARTHEALAWKVRTFQIEAERDPDFDCHVPGSARSLALSIAADVIWLACTPAEEIAA